MDHPIARRTVIAGAGAGLAAGLVGEAGAQSKPDIQASERTKQGRDKALSLSQARSAEAGRTAAGRVPGARLVQFVALEL